MLVFHTLQLFPQDTTPIFRLPFVGFDSASRHDMARCWDQVLPSHYRTPPIKITVASVAITVGRLRP